VNILLIDDDMAVRRSLELFLTELGHTVTCASDGREGMETFERGFFNLVLTDIKMPHMDGFELLRALKTGKGKIVDVVIITGHGDIDSVITALREGAYDYLQKPINIEELSIIIDRIAEHLSLKMANEELTSRFEEQVRARVGETKSQLEQIRKAYGEKIGLSFSIHSKKLADIFALAEKFHRSPSAPVLIEGETGTGKELLARYIHYGPEIVTRPFIAINCASIPNELFESELFGHETGAFTGAGPGLKKGQMEIAEDGTLLLDEIGEMPLTTQAKLLRVLEEREFYRVGGVKRIQFRARIIASTNKSLMEEVSQKRFRSDLYHRLNVGYLKIPPLAERTEEIVPLANDFLKKVCARHGNQSFKGISPGAEKFLESLSWPGNVRQLENAIERVVLIYESPYIEVDHLRFLEPYLSPTTARKPVTVDDSAPARTFSLPKEGIDLDELINRMVKEAMEMAGGNKTIAAKLLHISPRTISRRLEREDLD